MENSTAQLSTKQTCEPGPKLSAAQKEEIVKRLLTCAEALGLSISPERLDVYLHDLNDLPFYLLINAIDGWRRKSKYFPTIAELRELVLPTPNEDAAAEAAWANLEAWIENWYHGDMGLLPKSSGGREVQPPPLDPRTEHACRMIGHYSRIHAMIQSSDQYTWIKKEFLNAWKMARDVALDMGDRKLLAAIMEGGKSPPKALPEKHRHPMTAAENEAAREEFKRAIKASDPPLKVAWKPLTPEQFEARKALLRQQAVELMRNLPGAGDGEAKVGTSEA